MSEVKVTLNPSEEIVAASKDAVVITDRKGRKLTLKEPSVLAQYRLIEALGDTAANTVYLQMVVPLIYLAKIDDEDIFPCANKLQVEALIQQLDNEGINALMEGVGEHFSPKPQEEVEKQIKK